MNIIQIQNDLKNVSDQALINYVQNPTGHVPSFLALGELQRRKDMRAEYVKNNPPKSTVAQDLEQSASKDQGLAMLAKHPMQLAQAEQVPQSQGVANLSTGGMFDEKNFATGGIVAFANNRNQPVSADMPDLSGKPLSYWDTIIPSIKAMKEKEARDIQAENLRQLKFWSHPFAGGYTPTTSPALTASQVESKINQDALAQANNQNTANTQVQQPVSNPFDTMKVAQTPVEKVGDLKSYADEMKQYIGEDPNRAALLERISKMDTKAAEEERVAPWMALAQAGFGMAAGKSPYALSNVGEGALAGIKSYGEAKDKLEKLEEKRFDLSNDLAKSQRAETIAEAKYGADSKQAAETRAASEKLNNAKMQNDWNIARLQATVTGQNKTVANREAAEAKAIARFKLMYGNDAAISGDPTMASKYNQILMEEYKNFGIPLSPTSVINSPANDLSKWTVKPK